MSLLGRYPCDNVTAPTYLSYSSASVSIVISLVAISGNSVLVLAIVVDPNRNLRSSFNYFLACLGCADLIVGLLTVPVASMYLFLEGLKYRSLAKIQVFLHMIYFIPCTASLLSLTALAVDRYVAIAYPLFYRAKLNPFRAFVVSVVVWIVSVLLTLVYFLVQYNVYRFVFANTAIVVTFAVLIFTYAKMFKYLRSQVRQWDDLHDSTQENLVKKQAMKWEKKITKTMVIILAFFLACYLPSCVCIYIINFCPTCDCVFIHWVRDIQFVLVMANSGVNPFVYAWRLENFRSAFKVLLTCRLCLQRVRSVSTSVALTAVSAASPAGASTGSIASDPEAESESTRNELNQITVSVRL